METKRFYLEIKQNPKAVKIIQIVFGIICIILALSWIFYNLRSLKSDGTVWITIAFLIAFGGYQILAGLGKTERYLETCTGKIIIRQNSFLPKITLNVNDIDKVEIFPLSILFALKNQKKIIFRFGLTNTEIINPVKDEIIAFSELNSIPWEEKKEDV